jgi:hypothetical protein
MKKTKKKIKIADQNAFLDNEVLTSKGEAKLKKAMRVLKTEECKPFIPVGKNGKRKVVKFERYPHIPILSGGRIARSLLGKRLFWLYKEDGECVTVWFKKHTAASKSDRVIVDNRVKPVAKWDVMIASRNQEVASKDIQYRVMHTEEYSKLVEMIVDNPMFRVVVEECRKGRSVTGIKTYDRDQLFVIDIYDTAQDNWLPYTAMYQTTYHYGLQAVKLYAETRHRTIKDLLKFKNHVLEVCNVDKDYGKDEGMVCKTFDENGELLMAKVKLDLPEPKIRKIREGQPIYPTMPDGEVYNSIDKAYQELGDEKFKEVKLAMPLIAKYVGEAAKEHLYSSPKGKLFNYYNEFLERYVNQKT